MTDTRKSLPLARLYEKKLSGGRVHLTGRLGHSRVVIVPSGTSLDGTPYFTMFLTADDAPAADGPSPVEERSYGRLNASAMFTKRP